MQDQTRVMHPLGESDDDFRCDAGLVAKRENGQTPNGNPVGGRWVLRDQAGAMLDFDQYRHDLFERNGLRTHY